MGKCIASRNSKIQLRGDRQVGVLGVHTLAHQTVMVNIVLESIAFYRLSEWLSSQTHYQIYDVS